MRHNTLIIEGTRRLVEGEEIMLAEFAGFCRRGFWTGRL
jgi:hypothetical protein